MNLDITKGKIIKNIEDNIGGLHYIIRSLGALEGFLMKEGVIIPGADYEFIDIKYETRNIFFKKVIKSRKETYKEHIIRLTKDSIKS